jgi:hypothetical protein
VNYQREVESGGIEVLRDAANTADSAASALSGDTVQARLPGGEGTVFHAGDVFVSDSGRLRLEVLDSGGATAKVRVDLTSSRPSPSVRLSRSTWEAPDAGGTVGVVVDSGQATWTATSGQPWVSPNPVSGTGRTLILTVAANTTGVDRSATISVTVGSASATVTVTQLAHTDDCGPVWNSAPCTWADPLVPATGRIWPRNDVDVWKVSVPTSGVWVFRSTGLRNAEARLYGPAGADLGLGESRGPQGFSLAYHMTAGHDCYLSVESSTGDWGQYTLTAEPASIAVSQTSWSPDAQGDSTLVTLTSTTGRFRATANEPWLSVIPANDTTPFDGSVIEVTARGNSGALRTGTVTFDDGTAGGARHTMTVTQFGGAVALWPMTWTAPVGGGTVSVQLAPSHTTWAVASAPAWVRASPTSGSGEGTVQLTAAANLGPPRSGGVVFRSGDASSQVTITQPAGPAAALGIVAPVRPARSTGEALDLGVYSGSDWEVVSSPGWIEVNPLRAPRSTERARLTVALNVGPARSGVVRFANAAGGQADVTVAQDRATLAVWNVGGGASAGASASGSLPGTGDGRTYAITVPSSGVWVFRAVSTDGRAQTQLHNSSVVDIGASVEDPDSGAQVSVRGSLTAGAMYYLTVSPLPTSRPLGDYTISASPATLTVTPETWAVASGGASRAFAVSASVGQIAAVSDAPAWLSVSPATRTGPGVIDGTTVSVQAAANPGSPPRTGTITLTAPGTPPRTITVTQAPASAADGVLGDPGGQPLPLVSGEQNTGPSPGDIRAPAIAKLRTSIKTLTLVRGTHVKVPVVADAAAGSAAGKAAVTWTSSSAKIASVAQGAKSGTVHWRPGRTTKVTIKALALGKTTVTFRSATGAKLVLKITVVKNRKPATKAVIATKTKRVAKGKTATLVVKAKAAGATNTVAVWRSSTSAVATVDAAGRITARSRGKTTITVKIGGKTARRVITVT